MIAAGLRGRQADANSLLRVDPVFKMAHDLSPVGTRSVFAVDDLASGKICRTLARLLRMGRAMIDLCARSIHARSPKRITLDIDDNVRRRPRRPAIAVVQCAPYDEYGFQPIVVFPTAPGPRFVTAVLRPARRPGGKEIRALLRRPLVRAIRSRQAQDRKSCCVATAGYCTPEDDRLLPRQRSRLHLRRGADTRTLRAHIWSSRPRRRRWFEAAPKNGKVRRFKECSSTAPQSWSRVERIVARVEAKADGPDTRFVVTNLTTRNARRLYEDIYCRRGQAENHIKSWKTHLAADRTSCMKASANQLRLFLHAGAYWLMWGLRQSMPRRSMWRVAQFDTLRLRLIKIAARVVEMKTMIRVHLPTSCCGQDILRFALEKSRVSPHGRRGVTPENQTCPVNPQTLPLRTLAMPPVTKMRVGATENSRSHHQKTAPQAARSSSAA